MFRFLNYVTFPHLFAVIMFIVIVYRYYLVVPRSEQVCLRSNEVVWVLRMVLSVQK